MLEQGNYFVQAPNVIGYARFHCRGDPKRLVNPAEVVVQVMERHSGR